jgi:hypothetical protein
MRTFKPKYLVHGHIHLYSLSDVRVTNYEGTQVINAFSHYVINTGDARGDDTGDDTAGADESGTAVIAGTALPPASKKAKKKQESQYLGY